jgi:4-hydroxyproline epimerase
MLDSARVRVANVPSYRYRRQVAVSVAGRTVHGDIAWGGNWFFICHDHGLPVDMQHLDELGAFSREIRHTLDESGITGVAGGVIDHVELLGPPSNPAVADGRNYVLCPGGAYDRSPCGTGTSAKIACLAADGKLAPGQWYRQESVVGSVFEAAYQVVARGTADDPDRLVIAPTLIGSAYVNAEAELLLRSDDPFSMGITT